MFKVDVGGDIQGTVVREAAMFEEFSDAMDEMSARAAYMAEDEWSRAKIMKEGFDNEPSVVVWIYEKDEANTKLRAFVRCQPYRGQVINAV